jgi:hypothetical protein
VKPFDQVLYDQDDKAKDIVVDWLQRLDYTACVNPDQYGIDVLAELGGNKYQFEVEVKHNWKGYDFPYDTVHFAARKIKFAKEMGSTYFIMFNDDLSNALSVHSREILNSEIVSKNTKYTSNEQFVAVPFSKCTRESIQ